MEKPVEQLKAPIPETSRTHDTIVPIPDFAIPHIGSRDGSGSRIVNRKPIQDVNRELPTYPNPTY